MGSSKTANALMVEYNYMERGKKALLVKPRLDSRDGDYMIRSRMGLEKEGILLEELVELTDEEIKGYDCIIVDEAQFASKDFRREFFEGSLWLMAWADKIEEIKTVCWCGRAATCNARIGEDGRMIQSGQQIVMGGNDKYTALCRKHHRMGSLGPKSI